MVVGCGRLGFDPQASGSDGSLAIDTAPGDTPFAIEFTAPTPLGIAALNDLISPAISTDERELMFALNDVVTGYSLYSVRRADTTSPWGPPVKLAALDDAATEEESPWMAPSGLEMLYSVTGGTREVRGTARMEITSDTWRAPALVSTIPVSASQVSVHVASGHVFASDGSGVGEFDKTGAVVPQPNLVGYESPSISVDGLEIFMSKIEAGPVDRPYVARRASLAEPFPAPERVKFAADADAADLEICRDGHHLYMTIRVGGRYDLYVAER